MVADRKSFVPAGSWAGSGGLLAGRAGELLDRLTPAERLVAIQVALGHSNKEIASALGRAEPTIKHQVSSAIRKLEVQSRCQLIVRLLT